MTAKDRIIQLMEAEKLSPSIFADKVRINRSSISHILKERNAPSYNILTKICATFPKLNSDWLIMGQGEMYTGDRALEAPSLYDENLKNEAQYRNVNKFSTVEASNSNKTEHNPIEKQQVIELKNNSKSIRKIVVYYTDGTYQEFSSTFNPF